MKYLPQPHSSPWAGRRLFIKISTKQSLPLPRTGCKCSDAVPAVPRKHMASSVCLTWEAKFPQDLGRVGFWGKFTVHNMMSGGFLLWLIRKKLEKSLPDFFSFPCGNRINALKSHPGFNLLWLSPWDGVVDLCFSFLTWEFLIDVQIDPSYFCLVLGSGDARDSPACILSCVIHALKQSRILINERQTKHKQLICQKFIVSLYSTVW